MAIQRSCFFFFLASHLEKRGIVNTLVIRIIFSYPISPCGTPKFSLVPTPSHVFKRMHEKNWEGLIDLIM